MGKKKIKDMDYKKIREELKAAGIETGTGEKLDPLAQAWIDNGGVYSTEKTKLEGTPRERKLKQGRDRVDEMYKDTHWIHELVYMNRHLIQGLPPWGEPVLLKDAWKRGDTHYDVPGVYRYTDTRDKKRIYYGMSVCSIRARTYKFIRHTRFADSKEVTKDGRLRCNEQHSKTWVFKLDRTYKDLMDHVTVEYLPLPIEVAPLVESSLLSDHYTRHGNLPLLNSSF